MPTSRRSSARLDLIALTSWPQITIRPPWVASSPFMQRSSVLLPDPLRPTMATSWPWRTSSDTPSRTFSGPKYFVTFWTLTTMSAALACPLGSRARRPLATVLSCDMQFPFENTARYRQRVADREIDRGDEQEDQKRLKRRIVDDLAGARQFDEADDRCQRGVLHHLDHEPNRRRGGDAHRLRQDDVGVLLETVETEAVRRLPLGARNRFDAAAPDLAEKRADIECQRQSGRDQRIEPIARETEAKIGQEQQHQQRRALHDLDVTD